MAWKAVFTISGFDDPEKLDEEIDRERLCDPEDPLTLALIYMYSMETFLN